VTGPRRDSSIPTAIDPRDEAWLLARERGESMPPPSPETARVYARIEHAIAALPSVLSPGLRDDDAWEQQVLRALPPVSTSRSSSDRAPIPISRARTAARWALMAAPALAAAAAVVVWLRSDPRPVDDPPPEAEALALTVRSGPAARRGGPSALVGDVLEVSGRVGAAGELRVYRGERALVRRCPGDSACRASGVGAEQAWIVDLPLDAPGRYHVIGFVGALGGDPTGLLDSDLATATRDGAHVVTAPVLDVQ
jgi:hypothetical protein